MAESKGFYSYSWPRDGLSVDIFVHEVSNYRYHWHSDEYELNILLHGGQDFCFGKQRLILSENDVILIPPGVGHGSFAQTAGTRAMVMHFPVSALRPLVKKGCCLDFGCWIPSDKFRTSSAAKKIRFLTADLYRNAFSDSPASQMAVRGILLQLIAYLYNRMEPTVIPFQSEEDEQKELISGFTSYIDRHFSEKVTLEDLAAYSQYNRTYISTLFHNVVGVGFHDYLMRVRFQHALFDLAAGSDKNLTDIALDNGFSDLKSLNKYCLEYLDRTPAEYRAQVDRPFSAAALRDTRNYILSSDETVQKKIREFTRIADFSDIPE